MAGLVLWEGKSRLDNSPICVIITGDSKNEKTGGMLQTWILRSDVSPMEAIKTGQDYAICGDCQHRGDGSGKNRSCYVIAYMGPRAVYDKYKRGGYHRANEQNLKQMVDGKSIRLGSYGDPAAVPSNVWKNLLSLTTKKHTGYTHQWAKECDEYYKRILMASCDSELERQAAQSAGWRTFRVKRANDKILKGEIVCPASNEAGNRLECHECLACNGSGDNPNRVSIVINVHGSTAVKANGERLITSLTLKQRN